MEKVKVNYLFEGSVARVVLDDGKANILDIRMMTELTALLTSMKDMSGLKLVTFEGEGKNFSYGASVAEHTEELSEKMLETFHGLFYALMELSTPTLAKISGQCLGGGFELPLACNFIFADQSARIGQPEIMLGVFAPPASVILPMRVGYLKAEELLLTGKIINAMEAKSMGLVNEVYEDKQSMEQATEDWIKKYILPKSAASLRYAVRAVRLAFDKTMRSSLPALSELYNNELMKSHDANEGIKSFMEKRKPEWKNR